MYNVKRSHPYNYTYYNQPSPQIHTYVQVMSITPSINSSTLITETHLPDINKVGFLDDFKSHINSLIASLLK